MENNNNLNDTLNKISPQGPEKKPFAQPPLPKPKQPFVPAPKTSPLEKKPHVVNKPPAPELADRMNVNDNVVPVQKKKPVVKKNVNEKAQTVLDVGPAKKWVGFKKIGKIFGFAILGVVVLVGIYAGYRYFINLGSAEVPEEKIRRTREISERDTEDDPTSLDALEKRFRDFGSQTEIMEKDANFESKLDLGKSAF